MAGTVRTGYARCGMERFGIATRSGAHCAPLAHGALGTVDSGIVRFSFSGMNSEEDAKMAADAVRILAEEMADFTIN